MSKKSSNFAPAFEKRHLIGSSEVRSKCWPPVLQSWKHTGGSWKEAPENSRLDELLILSSFFYAPYAGRVQIERLSKQ